MHWVIEQGYAFYWATSEWSAERISEAIGICKRLGLHKPIADQCEYSALKRENFEKNLRPCYETHKYGTTIWSPLAGGILTGKYNDGVIPEDTRYTTNPFVNTAVLPKYFGEKTKEETLRILKVLKEIADEQGCTMAQLALAWAIVNKDVSTCIFGATKLSQFEDNMKALDVAENWSEELEKRVNDLLANEPEPVMDFNVWKPKPHRRELRVDYKFKAFNPPHPYMSFQESSYKKEE